MFGRGGSGRPEGGAGPPVDDAALERLRALGYAHWGEADPGTRSGVTRHDPERAQPGYNLYTNQVDEVYLVDLAGRRVHTWRVPPSYGLVSKGRCEHAELRPDGRLFVVCFGHALTVLDWDSRVVWERIDRVHHDVAWLPDGSLVVPYHPLERPYRGRLVRFDALAHYTPDGEALDDLWSTWERLDGLRPLFGRSVLDRSPPRDSLFGLLASLRQRFDYFHLNAVQVLPDTALGRRDPRFRAGNLLVCLRNVDLVAVVDQRDGEVVWSWGRGVLDMPHMPVLLESGHLLVYDNGPRRGYTRVLEVRLPDGEIHWSYQGEPRTSFFSPRQGSSQRLPNGNTLITESRRGHALEVTRDGGVVWEFWNPEIEDGRRKVIYRLVRVPPEWVEPHLRAP